MSDITKHQIPESLTTAIGQIDAAVEKILEAQKLNESMQRSHKPGDPAWHLHETIDDKLHDALAALGQ